ncbi:transglutaminase-like domain-containing protein [Endozoicomonas arenosclerae]|uniref:transglutaminase-like domain-containing protein n=1 Tax=Endozoicomonas arenosclerae TaxID=1633495 RepID=UPI00078027F4|nr:transglutaminase-like domain-containing protein [Endozoicomonas arenosclerae]
MSVQFMESFRQGVLGKGLSLFLSSLFVFVFFLSPTGKAVADNIEKEAEYERRLTDMMEDTPEKKLAHRLHKLKEWVADDEPGIRYKENSNQGLFASFTQVIGLGDKFLSSSDRGQLTELYSGIDQAYTEAWSEWQNLEVELKKRDLPAIAMERHREAMEQFKEQYSEFTGYYQQLEGTTNNAELQSVWEELGRFLNQQQFQKSHAPFDPNKLPFGTPDSEVREPKVTNFDLQSVLGLDPLKGVMVANSGPLPSSATNALFAQRNDQPADTYLQETPDITISDEMRSLAAELNHNPTEIYSWVHNNIRFIPSYGSIQGAAMTLDTRRGNATDTASLLIGLLRASNIPARYAYGTVEVPVEKVMNWVGGVEVPAAAQNLMGQGGIPNTGLIYGGKVTQIRMEHTWVEAWVDFEPSRGVKNREGDNWIPMDASFKQYEFTDGMDLQEQVPFDAQALIDEIKDKATIDEELGFVQNLPQADIEQQLEDYQQKLQDYIENQNPDATVGEVLGLQEVKVKSSAPLSAGLPYQVLVTSERFIEVPDKLRHKFKYQLQTQISGQPGATLFTFEQPTVTVAGKKLALSFRPSTEEDEAIIERYLPKPNDDGSPIDPSQLPATLPGYLIDMTAEFTLDGEVELTAGAGKMGTELYSTLGLYSPTHRWTQANNKPIAGEYRAIGLDLQGNSTRGAEKLKNKLKKTHDVIESGDTALISALSGEDVQGDLLYSPIFAYLAMNNIQDQVQANNLNIINYRLPSYGVFGTRLESSYFFGIPKSVRFSGLGIDVDRLASQTVDTNNDLIRQRNYTRGIGIRASVMEHLIPESMFTITGAKVSSMSAIKALSIAASQGQRIWSINSDNIDAALESINLSAQVESDIRNSVKAGKIVTAHGEPLLSGNGWNAGYLIIDPSSGSGAYKIASGDNGGLLEGVQYILMWLGWAFTYKAGLLGVSPNPVAPFFTVAWTTIGAIQIASSCEDPIARALAMTAFISAVIVMFFLLTLVAFPLSLLSSVAGFHLIGFYKRWLISYC